ncbi:MAG: carbamoyl phosphate synthase small subunit [Oscillospiraceae bacterium]
MLKNNKRAYLVLADGTVFNGFSMGKVGTTIGEVVFNTCTASYNDILSDPTYYGQIVAQTYPLAFNRGVANIDENSQIMANGYIAREWCDVGENEKSLDKYLLERSIVGIFGIDTRRLTRAVRDKGYMKGAITESLNDFDNLLKQIKCYTLNGAVEAISIKEPLKIKSKNSKYKLCVMDYGFPRKILNAFTSRDCDIIVLPYSTTSNEISQYKPDGILLSDGPSDPDDNKTVIENISEMIKLDIPIMGIGLGHQMLALANGFKIEKMPQGHRGSNQPVRIIGTDKFMVTDQNHGYSVDINSIEKLVAEPFLTNINDNSVEGLKYKDFNGISVQFTPNGDKDSSTSWIFDEFINRMEEAHK